MSKRILCGGCGKVYPLWIAANAKPANCSECGTQVEQRQVQPQVPVSPIDTYVTPVPKNDIDFTMIFFNTAIIGIAVLLIISVIWLGTRMFNSETPTVATNPKPPAQAEPSSPAERTITATSDIEDNADEDKAAADKAEAEKKAAAEAEKKAAEEAAIGAGNGWITDVFDEKSIGRSVGLVQTAMALKVENETIRHLKTLYKTVSSAEFKASYDKEDQKFYEDNYPKVLGNQLVPCGGAGTCFLVTADGFAITNFHVVDNYLDAKDQRNVYGELADLFKADTMAPKLIVYLDGAPHDAEVEFNSTEYDFAILKIDTIANYPFFQLASTETIPRLTKVTVLGFPGSARTVFNREEYLQNKKNRASNDPRNWFKESDLAYVATVGEISRVSERGDDGLIVQHTAVIDGGNSGGPLVTNDGIVVGINTWSGTKVQSSGFVDGVGNNFSLAMYSLIRDIRKNSLKVKWIDTLPKPNN